METQDISLIVSIMLQRRLLLISILIIQTLQSDIRELRGYSITLEPWGECTADCVALRNILCTDQNGNVADESKCDGISDIKHYRGCTGGLCGTNSPPDPSYFPVSKPTSLNPTLRPTHRPTPKRGFRHPPTHKPTRSPTHKPTSAYHRQGSHKEHDESVQKGGDIDEGGQLSDDRGNGLVDPSDVLTHVVNGKHTHSPSLAPSLGGQMLRHKGAIAAADTRKKVGSKNRSQSMRDARMAGFVTLFLLGFLLSIILVRSFGHFSDEGSVKYSKLNQIDKDDALEFPEGELRYSRRYACIENPFFSNVPEILV